MEKILEFFKSLVVPIKMAKYRYMSVLLSVIIFLVSTYLISVPMSHHINQSSPQLRESYNYLVLTEIEPRLNDNEESLKTLRDLAALECTVVEGILDCPNLPKTKDETSETEKYIYDVFDSEVVIIVEGITKRIRFIVDLNTVEPKFEDMVIDIEHTPYVSNEEVYKVILNSTSIYYQAHQREIAEQKITHNGVELKAENRYYSYQTSMPDFTLKFDEASARGIGRFILDALIQADLQAYHSNVFISLLMQLFLLPLLVVFIFRLVFKKHGKLTTFKEYYNIAAISSIVPIILLFIIAWFWNDVLQYYYVVYLIFYLYSLYKINNSPDELI